MKCPKCGGKATVKNTLHTDDNETYRKIKCQDIECGNIFYTIEYEVEYDERLKKELAKCERMLKENARLKGMTAKRNSNRRKSKWYK